MSRIRDVIKKYKTEASEASNVRYAVLIGGIDRYISGNLQSLEEFEYKSVRLAKTQATKAGNAISLAVKFVQSGEEEPSWRTTSRADLLTKFFGSEDPKVDVEIVEVRYEKGDVAHRMSVR